jgi:hexosaminidase
MTQAIDRYTRLIFEHPSDVTSGLQTVYVTIADNDESHPQLETDESYTLKLSTDNSCVITAQTIYGAMRGLETFSQLVTFDHVQEAYVVLNGPWSISDAPRFPHRGLMIDTARHFQTLRSIRGVIDALPYAKLNVLHWHMSDSQSFPLQVKSNPKLWEGSWSSYERYTQRQVASIVEYARLRGVRVIVEFDMPGHAASWCVGYPEICPSPTCTQPLNVATNVTFDLITALLLEMTGGHKSLPRQPSGLFPDDFIHLGGDEVNTDCWTSTPAVNNWLVAHNMSADDAYAYFVKRAADIALNQGRRPVQWSEVFDHFKGELDKKTIVHIWKSVTNVTEVVALGYNVLLNVGYDSQSWYLDNLNVMWNAVYAQEPCTGVPDNLCPLILGGHGEMWGETVDSSNIELTVWPRLAAIAERLWSPRSVTSTASAHPRIQYFRCLLNERGVRAAPVNNANARSAPPGPGSCYLQ